MAAYVISEVEMIDREAFETYRALAQSAIVKYGGRYLVRGGATEAVEGPAPKHIVIVEFPSGRAHGRGTARRSTARPLSSGNTGRSDD